MVTKVADADLGHDDDCITRDTVIVVRDGQIL